MSPIAAQVCVDTPALAADKPYDYAVPSDIAAVLRPGMRIIVPFGKGNQHCEAMVLRYPHDSKFEHLKPVLQLLDSEPIFDTEQLRLAYFLRERLFCPLYGIFRVMLPAGLWFSYENAYMPSNVSENDALSAVSLYNDAARIVNIIWHAGEPVPEQALRSLMPKAELHGMLNHLLSLGYLRTASLTHLRSSEKNDRLFSLTDAGVQAISDGIRLTSSQSEVLRFLSQSSDASLKEICYYTEAGESVVRTLVKKGWVHAYLKPVLRVQEHFSSEPVPVNLSSEQQNVFNSLSSLAFQEPRRSTNALLFGITGSGKTSVYIRLIQEMRSAKRDVIVLVPEIALTPQMMDRFFSYWGQEVAVMHSALSVSMRADSWKRIRNGDVHIVLGTRSAVFAPVRDLGLIIMDEEHDGSYKSDTAPCYHARDVAAYRCARNNAMLLLGSATPSITTMYAAQSGKIELFSLTERYGSATLPETIIADSREAYRHGYTGLIGPVLSEQIMNALDKNEQCILFLDRRGASRQLVCMECGYVPGCVRCSVPMHYHSANRRLICHQCGYTVRMPEVCPSCGVAALHPRDAGTQMLETELKSNFPSARIIRMDSDTTGGSHSHTEMLDSFSAGEADILLGTRMVAKGLNFPNVTVVGVIDADMSLYTNDFRAGENTFDLLTQVIGRSGRGTKKGVSVIQTASPDHEVIKAAAAQDYMRFYESEISLRSMLRHPPFTHLATVTVSGNFEEDVLMAASSLRDTMMQLMPKLPPDTEFLGPAPHPVTKLNNRYRYNLTIRCSNGAVIRALTAETIRTFQTTKQRPTMSIFADLN